ncbi:MAG: Nif3-like dinuclear metal center hexameric protein [Anaerolineae bacterium]|nr:Nif3-like dinuclear metal center hexameric protein [Anaerolineae bacterium]
MTIQAFIEQLKTSAGLAWEETAIDAVLYGDPDVELKNVAVTMMATQEVLEEAVSRDCNLIITHEPVFYSHQNKFQHLLGDAVYLAKEKYLRDHRLCVFHLHDNVHHGEPDYIALGMAHKLNWAKYCTDESFMRFRMPGVKLAQILGDIETSLEPAALKYIGDKDAVYENVVTSWGFMMMENGVRLINRHERCLLIAGETHEWEFIEYARDAHHLGLGKAFIMVGHVPSEAGGMEYFCGYLQEKFPSVSISYINTGDLFGQSATHLLAS